jgi:hypothetical protein
MISETELKDGNLIEKKVTDRIYSDLGSKYNSFLILIQTQNNKKLGLFVHKKLTKDTDYENASNDNLRLTESPLIAFYIINEKELVTVYGKETAPFISNDENLISTYGVSISNDR